MTPGRQRRLAPAAGAAGAVALATALALLPEMWGADHTGRTHSLRIHMGNLRAKLERDPAEPRVLPTEPGVGYRLAAD